MNVKGKARLMTVLAISLAAILALSGCSLFEDGGSNLPGYTDLTFKSTEEVREATMDQFGELIADSDTDGLVETFSENAHPRRRLIKLRHGRI